MDEPFREDALTLRAWMVCFKAFWSPATQKAETFPRSEVARNRPPAHALVAECKSALAFLEIRAFPCFSSKACFKSTLLSGSDDDVPLRTSPAAAVTSARFNHMKSLRDVPEHVLREITNFFEVMTELSCTYVHGVLIF